MVTNWLPQWVLQATNAYGKGTECGVQIKYELQYPLSMQKYSKQMVLVSSTTTRLKLRQYPCRNSETHTTK